MMEEDKYSTKLYGMVRVVRMVGIRSGFGIFNTGLGGMRIPTDSHAVFLSTAAPVNGVTYSILDTSPCWLGRSSHEQDAHPDRRSM
ncbi:hypothetical protein An17g02050 [Aspergillus niger]|uniref:Uncharacterized protein n=2 Tax=Aspergillus niger TaxID=5061 RepID=A2R9N3_ASPNC|nr:hypothetical protein An17g02050 [Aspergillus niger]CAK43078.1 hypothetical protein An17g02050 [Aspergillus niger]